MTLGNIADSDVNVIAGISEEQLLGADAVSTPNDRAKFLRRAKQTAKQAIATTSRGSRKQFEARLNLLPVEIQKGLANQSLQPVDFAVYSVKKVENEKQMAMFRDDDNKSVGVTNLSSAKLEKGSFFLLNSVRLSYGVADLNETNPSKVNFSSLPDFIKNGEFELKANGAVLIPRSSLELFNTTGSNTLVENTLVLDNPKILRDQQTIEFNVEFPTQAPARSYLKVTLIGTTIVKA